MKIAAVHALARLAREPIPDDVLRAYNLTSLEFGPNYIIPKPFDPRVLTWVAPAVAKAACESGVARQPIDDWDGYVGQLEKLQGPSYAVIEPLRYQAQALNKRIAFAEGEQPRIVRAARRIADLGICRPVLVGRATTIEAQALELGLSLDGIEIHDSHNPERRDAYAHRLWEIRKRKGVHMRMARQLIRNRNYYSMMMYEDGLVDGVISGYAAPYPEVLRPALQVLGTETPGGVVSGVYAMAFKNQIFFFGDCTVNIEPNASDLVKIAYNTAKVARMFHIEPRVAFLSFSNFGDVSHPRSAKIQEAVRLMRASKPDFQVDGEMQANVALNVDLRERTYPFCEIQGQPTVLIFPDLESGNIAYKLLATLGGATPIGPILVGLNGAVTALQMGCDVEPIVDMATITACVSAKF
jgi:malate dehydrogenase (oxaloacetate-decarboxylating)(NADP+)